MNGLDVLALMGFILCAVWIASMLDPMPTEADDREVREKIEEQREADFYREDPADMPLDEEAENGDD